jgi:hypothetical protein
MMPRGRRPGAGGKPAGGGRLLKGGLCAVVALVALRFTILAPESSEPVDRGLAPAAADDVDAGPVVTTAPIEPVRDPFAPVNGG